MNLAALSPGARVVTSAGDIAEVLEVSADKSSARVRYVDTVGLSRGSEGSEVQLGADDIMTLAGERFVGPT